MTLRTRLRRGLTLVGGYLGIPLLNAFSPLIAIPAITHAAGAEAWAAVAIGQSLGATAAVLAELGWGISGTHRIARQAPRNIAQTFAMGLLTQVMVGIPAAVLAAIAAYLLAPEQKLTAALLALGTAATFSAAWVFVGIAQPRRILFQEALPRMAAGAIAGLLIFAGAPLIIYGIAMLAATVIGPVLACRALGVTRADLTRLSFARLIFAIRCQGKALTSRAFSSLYVSFGTTAVALVAPQATAAYAAVDRLIRMAQRVLASLHFVMKGWVGRATTRGERVRRATQAVLANAATGVVSGVAFAFLAPVIGRVIFSGVIDFRPEYMAIAGGTLAVIFVSMACGQILLVALNRIGGLAWSAVAGAAVGLPAILAGAQLGGVVGALVGQLTAEVVVLAVQLVVALRALRRRTATVRSAAEETPPATSPKSSRV